MQMNPYFSCEQKKKQFSPSKNRREVFLQFLLRFDRKMQINFTTCSALIITMSKVLVHIMQFSFYCQDLLQDFNLCSMNVC